MGTRTLSALHLRYLELIGVEPDVPNLETLQRLVRAHVHRIPFENISKLYYLRAKGFRGAPPLEMYLDGIEKHGFGGTCYTNNPHFSGLLAALGYDVRLCGADMTQPDVHTAILIRLDGVEYLVDTGYAAPFDQPMRRDLGRDVERRLGNERWVLKPADNEGRSEMQHHRDGRHIHGYTVKPTGRDASFFGPAIRDSFRPDATFMNKIRLVRFGDDWSLGISDLRVIHATPATCEIRRLTSREDLIDAIAAEFGISPDISSPALDAVEP